MPLLTLYSKFDCRALLVFLVGGSGAEDTALYADKYQSGERRGAVDPLVQGNKGIDEGEQQKSKMGQNKAQRLPPKTLDALTSTAPSELGQC